MKIKRIVIIVLILISVSALFARQENRTVPFTSEAYRVISVAEIRGIIPIQPDVKPYSFGRVKELLNEIKGSDLVSQQERSTIDRILAELGRGFGEDHADSFSSILKKGSFGIVDEDTIFLLGGGKLQSTQTLSSKGAFDSRNKIQAYISGDFGKSFSFSMNIGLLVDHLDHRAMLATDFTTDIEGWYMYVFSGGGAADKSPFNTDFDDFKTALKEFFGVGYFMSPEMGSSLFDGKLAVRLTSTKRDWGPGTNNLGLSGSARAFDAVEIHFNPATKFSFSVMVGSLGKAWVELENEPIPVGDREMHSDIYDNNFSIQRIEVGLFEGFKASIYESVVWRKRAELAYWNPFTIYMYAQNYLGDFDNVLAGMDFSYIIKGVGKLYFGFAFDEMNKTNPKVILTAARNIISLQGGAVFSIPGFSFNKITVQGTYIPPFFGPHYLNKENPWGSGIYGTAYVNKGQGLSYPLNPDSLELLIKYETNLPNGISLSLTAKDQMRSAQYSVNTESGTGLNDYMRYSLEYENKQFFKYIWNNIADIEIRGSKTFENYPITVTAGIQCIVDSRRDYSFNETVKYYPLDPAAGDNEKAYDEGPSHLFNPGAGTIMGSEWVTDFRFIGSIGFSLFY